MQEKIRVTLAKDVFGRIGSLAGSKRLHSTFLERVALTASDLELIHKAAGGFNREAEVLGCQSHTSS
jgi:hypothetical protein